MSPRPADTRRLVGRYRLDAELGRGAMGTVWSAYDEVLHRPVAVKEVRLSLVPVSERAIVRERTLREARATAMLSHPNVVTLYDVVEVNAEPYVVMELLPSRSLASYIGERGTLTPSETAEIGSAVASALMTAHRAGITHRDVKPGNVLIGTDGQIKLTDFGIARNAAESSMTQTGTVLGSPPYIAPEVAMGRTVGPPADLWGLGATLYACLEGRPPYDAGDPVSTVSAVVHGDVPRPKGHGPVQDVVRGLMVKDPTLRMPLPAVRRRLRPLMADPEGPVLSAPPSPATTEFRLPSPPARPDAADHSGLIPVARGRGGTLVDGQVPAEQPGPAPRTAPLRAPGRSVPDDGSGGPGASGSAAAGAAGAAAGTAAAGAGSTEAARTPEESTEGREHSPDTPAADPAASGEARAASPEAAEETSAAADGDTPRDGQPVGEADQQDGAPDPAVASTPADTAERTGAEDGTDGDDPEPAGTATPPTADDPGPDSDSSGTTGPDASATAPDEAGSASDEEPAGTATADATGAGSTRSGADAPATAAADAAVDVPAASAPKAEITSDGATRPGATRPADADAEPASPTSTPTTAPDAGRTDERDGEAGSGTSGETSADAPAGRDGGRTALVAGTATAAGAATGAATTAGDPSGEGDGTDADDADGTPDGTRDATATAEDRDADPPERPDPPSGTGTGAGAPATGRRPTTPAGGTPRSTPSGGMPVPAPSAAETTMVTPRVAPRRGPTTPGPWPAPAPPHRRPPYPNAPPPGGPRRPGGPPQSLASDPGPLPFAPSRPTGPTPEQQRRRRVAVVALVVLLALAGLLGGYVVTRLIGGQPPFSISLAPAGPVVDGEQLVVHSDDNARYSGTGMGFTALVPATWQQFRLQQPGGDIVVRYVSDDATRELRIDKLVAFYPAQNVADYARLLADPSKVGADGVRVEPLTQVAPARPGAREAVQQTAYRTQSGQGAAVDDRVTWTRLIPSGTDLWVVRMTAPTDDYGGAPQQFAAVADSFDPPV